MGEGEVVSLIQHLTGHLHLTAQFWFQVLAGMNNFVPPHPLTVNLYLRICKESKGNIIQTK